MLDFLKNVKKDTKLEIDIETLHKDYIKWIPVWTKNRDTKAGSEAVKLRSRAELKDFSADTTYTSKWQDRIPGTAYLPFPSGMDNQEYLNYRERAIYANYVVTTITSWQGMLYAKPIQYHYKVDNNEISETDDKFLDNITFDGQSADTFIHDVTEEIEVVNKVGVLVDYPTITDSNGNPVTLTKKMIEEKDIKARLSMYKAESITNWGDAVIDNQRTPVFFIVKEKVNNDQFTGDCSYIYRVLYLDDYIENGITKYQYKQAVIKPLSAKERGGSKYKSVVVNSYTPYMNGKPIESIPFYVMTDKGTEYRKYENSIISPLVDTNIGHYRNSADSEHELFKVSIKTLVLMGWKKKDSGNPKMGQAINIPIGGDAKLLEASSDSALKDEMQRKEQRMAVFGSQKIAQQGRYVASAETSDNNTRAETSNLQSISLSTSKTMSIILTLSAEWSGKPYTIDVELNKDFKADMIRGEEAVKWSELYMSGNYSFDAYFDMMQKREAYPEGWTKDDEIEALLNNPMMGASNPAIDGIRRELEELRDKLNGSETETDNINETEEVEEMKVEE